MNRTPLLPIAVVTMLLILGRPPALADDATPQDAWLQEVVDELRQAEGLGGLKADESQSSFIQRKLETLLGGQWADRLEPAELAARAVADVPHWHHRHFVSFGEPGSDVLGRLKERSAFRAAVLWPEATHMAFGSARGAEGRLWCVGCVTRQMVELGPHESSWELYAGGGTGKSYTLCGRTQYPFVRVRFYQGDDDPTDPWGPGHRVDVKPDHTGVFRIPVPASELDEGEYRVVFYVSGYGDADYTIAAHMIIGVDRELKQGRY